MVAPLAHRIPGVCVFKRCVRDFLMKMTFHLLNAASLQKAPVFRIQCYSEYKSHTFKHIQL